jgi:hypothetical protein
MTPLFFGATLVKTAAGSVRHVTCRILPSKCGYPDIVMAPGFGSARFRVGRNGGSFVS